MAKVAKRAHLEGQRAERKSFAEKIVSGRKRSARDATQASKIMESMSEKLVNRRGAKSQAPTTSKGEKYLQPERTTAGSSRPEAQERAQREFREASKEFSRSKEDAKGLRNLESRSKASNKSRSRVATAKPVLQKGLNGEPRVAKKAVKEANANLVQEMITTAKPGQAATRKGNEAALPRDKGAQKGKGKEKPYAKQNLQKNGAKMEESGLPKDQRRVSNAGNLAAAEVLPNKKGERKPSADRKRTGEKGRKRSTKSSGRVYTDGADRSRGFEALLGGSGGEADLEQFPESGSADLPSVDLKMEGREALPEMDPSLHIYSEFDTENPGVEYVKSKAQLFSRHIEKREKLQQIARLDQDLESRISDLFESTPLSDRILGELKEELKATQFLNNVYGGVRG